MLAFLCYPGVVMVVNSMGMRALGWCRVSVAGLYISSISVSLRKEAVIAGLQQLFRVFTNNIH